MNQIPNIEETHNTREVKEIVDNLRPIMKSPNFSTGDDDVYIHRDAVVEALHHRLQKARRDWLREEIVRLDGMKMEANGVFDGRVVMGHETLRQTIIDRYQAELDQDKNDL